METTRIQFSHVVRQLLPLPGARKWMLVSAERGNFDQILATGEGGSSGRPVGLAEETR